MTMMMVGIIEKKFNDYDNDDEDDVGSDLQASIISAYLLSHYILNNNNIHDLVPIMPLQQVLRVPTTAKT